MSVRFPLQRYLLSTLASTSIALATVAATQLAAQEPDRQKPSQQEQQTENRSDRSSDQTPRERQTDKAFDERADDEAPALGVLTGPCPGKAVCVKGTLQYSPADEAGIEPGDYILSVDGEDVTSPAALKKLISSKKPEAQVTLKVWRQGEEMERKVQLASKADALPKSHDAWLGVMLSNNEDGVTIDQIVPGSPASDSELEEGDTLVKVKGSEIEDAESFISKIEEMGPGDELKLTVRRDNEERDVTVQLGNFGEAPMAFLRQLQGNMAALDSQDQSSDLQLFDRAMDDVRMQIRELRNEVRELKGELGKEQPQANPAKGQRDNDKDVSLSDDANNVVLVSQIGRSGNRSNLRNNLSRGYNYGYNRNRSYYGNNYNRGFNPYPRYNYPNSSNYYYRYGGRPYYYGGYNNWYGNRPRSGLQLGPNLGIYWY